MLKHLSLRQSLMAVTALAMALGTAFLFRTAVEAGIRSNETRKRELTELFEVQAALRHKSMSEMRDSVGGHITDELYAFEGRQYRDSLENSRLQANQLARAVASLVVSDAGLAGPDFISDACRSVARDPELVVIAVQDADGRTLGGFVRSDHPGLIRRFAADGQAPPDDPGQVADALRSRHFDTTMEESAAVVIRSPGMSRLAGTARATFLNDRLERDAKQVADRAAVLKNRTVDTLRTLAGRLEARQAESAGEAWDSMNARAAEEARRSNRAMLAVSLAILALQLLAIYLIASRVVNPLNRAVDFASQLGQGQLDRRLEPPGQSDARRLTIALNSMAGNFQQHEADMRKKLAELNRTVEEARKDAADKTAFIAGMARELAGPIETIVDANREGGGDGRVQTREEAEKMKRLTGDVLDFTLLATGGTDLDRVPFSLDELLRDCEDDCRPQAREKGLALQFRTDPFAGGELYGDPAKLRRALTGLVAGGVRFTDAGAVRLTSRITRLDGDRIDLHFEVRDTSRGMTEEEKTRAFSPFAGSDLTWAIADKLVELMGGVLKKECVPSIGNVFSFHIVYDAAVDPGDVQPVPDGARIVEKKPAFAGDVLVFGQDDDSPGGLKESLVQVCLSVTIMPLVQEGADLAEARLAAGKPFDLALADATAVDCLEVKARLSRMGSKAPLVLATGPLSPGEREEFTRDGFAECLEKPVATDVLWACLKKHLPALNLRASGTVMRAQTLVGRPAPRDASTIDRVAGLERAGGDAMRYRSLLENFLRDNRRVPADIEDALEADDVPGAYAVLHSLVGMAAMIGATRLSEAAFEVEKALSGGSHFAFDDLIRRFREEFDAVMRELGKSATGQNGGI